MPGRSTHRRAAGAVGLVIIASIVLATPPTRAQDVLGDTTGVTGAGSTFVYPILARWSREYRAALARGGDFPLPNAGLEDPPASSALQYEPVGSLAGTLRVKDRAVDFGATEMPLASDELRRAGLGQFPIVIGGVVVAVNINGVAPGVLNLTGPVVADVFLGRISRWSDPAIKALNPTLTLPDAAIAVVHREDGSGTTFTFTDYLSRVSPAWKQQVGSALLVRWPTGAGAKGNDGVATAVKQRANTIGYVEYAQARQLGLSAARLQNRAGRFVTPDTAVATADAADANGAEADDEARDPFGEGAIGVEFGGAAFFEAWNLNDRREWLGEGSAAVWWNFTRRATLVVEFHAIRVAQASSRAAFINGFVPAVRWRLIERGQDALFVELGPGISWSDTRTPPRGTTFNYLIQGSAGWTHQLGRRTRLITSARWLHISNNSREGRSRNPDIEAVGGYGGLSIAF